MGRSVEVLGNSGSFAGAQGQMVRIGEDAGKGRLMITLEELKKELLADPLVAAEYEALKPKYAKLQAQIDKRRRARLAKEAAIKPQPPAPPRSDRSSHNH